MELEIVPSYAFTNTLLKLAKKFMKGFVTMKKGIFIRRILSVFLALIVCAGCCTPALAVEEPTTDASVIEETRETQEAVFDRSSDFPDPLIDRMIMPPLPTDWYILIFLIELPLLPFIWLGEKLSVAWNAIQDVFEVIEMFFYNLFHG